MAVQGASFEVFGGCQPPAVEKTVHNELIKRAVQLIESADALLITAGAGMGVDSGLPDFRGNHGFWKAYPALAASGTDFASIANPQSFRINPKRAWGFYGHRLDLYRSTVPHQGFSILKKLAERMPNGCFVATSNVDGQFQKAGFDPNRVLEIHGSIHFLQCLDGCREYVWSANCLEPKIDSERCLWTGNLPTCPYCGHLARPNIMMFDDWGWLDQRYHIQRSNWEVWLNRIESLVVIEIGAGVNIPSIRRLSERQGAPLIRINPRQPELPEGAGVSLPFGGLDALRMIETYRQTPGFIPG